MPTTNPTVLELRIESRIYLIRGQKVMIDNDLANLYDVPTKRLNEQVRRNRERFPADFMFQLTTEEAENLRSQIATSSLGYGGRRHLPYAFTEHGALMLASVLKSERAVQTSICVVRAFTRLRKLIATHVDLERKLTALEQKYDSQFRSVFEAIRQLMVPPPTPKRQIGFREHGVRKG
ncbi:MAG: ORF6N domain-containing protein [bacterium]|nr:ORF6N domain-containing protein [bacterium]